MELGFPTEEIAALAGRLEAALGFVAPSPPSVNEE